MIFVDLGKNLKTETYLLVTLYKVIWLGLKDFCQNYFIEKFENCVLCHGRYLYKGLWRKMLSSEKHLIMRKSL